MLTGFVFFVFFPQKNDKIILIGKGFINIILYLLVVLGFTQRKYLIIKEEKTIEKVMNE